MSTMAEKINKLLAQAEGTHSEAERESAMKMAYKLMAKYAIDELDLEAAGDNVKSKIIITEFRVMNPYSTARLALLQAISKNMDVQLWYTNHEKDSSTAELGQHWRATRLCGFSNDIERVKSLYESLNVQMDRSIDTEYKLWKIEACGLGLDTGRGQSKLWKASFMRSFGNRISGRLREMYRSEIVAAGHGLVLVDRKKKVEQHMFDEGIRLGSGNRNNNSNSMGSSAGFRSGDSAVLNKGIGAGR